MSNLSQMMEPVLFGTAPVLTYSNHQMLYDIIPVNFVYSPSKSLQDYCDQETNLKQSLLGSIIIIEEIEVLFSILDKM